MAYISKINNFTNNTDYDISAVAVKITDTTPSSATSYYLTYTSGKTANTNYTLMANADLYYYDTGTSSYLNIGSSSNSGGLTLHNANGKYGDIITSAFTENRTFTLPNKTGTIALTSDLSSYVLKAGDTMTGTLTNSTNIWAGIDANGNNVSSGECDIGTGGPSGKIYFFNTSGGRGIYGFNSSSAGAYILTVDSNNNVSLNGKANGLVDGTSTMTSAYNKAGLNYADYSWLAGWNGYELRAVAKTQFAQASHNHYQLITEGDNRSVATTPNSYNNNLVFRGLKTNSAFGSPSSDNYSYVVGLRGWSDASGGNAYELAFNNTGIYCRNGATTSWGSWNKILTLSDGNSAYVKKAGDSMTGSLTIQAAGDTYVWAKNTSTGNKVWLDAGGSANHGIWSDGYYNNSTFTSSGKWIIYRGSDGEAHTGMKLYGAVWNDYAEYRITKDIIKPGRCVIETGKDDLVLSTERLQPGAEIVSDTFGFAIGETDEAKTPIASNGRVLAYIYEGREAARAAIGKPVCSGPDGTVSIMTDEEYQKYGYCAIGTISAVPDYEEWGTGKVKVNNRIWIRIR